MFLKRCAKEKKNEKENTLGTARESMICGCITDALTRTEGREGDGMMEGWREKSEGRLRAGGCGQEKNKTERRVRVGGVGGFRGRG